MAVFADELDVLYPGVGFGVRFMEPPFHMTEQCGLAQLTATVEDCAALLALELTGDVLPPEEHLGRDITGLVGGIGHGICKRQGATQEVREA